MKDAKINYFKDAEFVKNTIKFIKELGKIECPNKETEKQIDFIIEKQFENIILQVTDEGEKEAMRLSEKMSYWDWIYSQFDEK